MTAGLPPNEPLVTPVRPIERFRLFRDRRRDQRMLPLGDSPRRHGAPSFRRHLQLFILGLVAILVIGTVLLALPLATASGHATPLLDAFFTAVSAACITGLTTVDSQTHWTGFGTAVILVLMEIGTLGFLVGASIVLQLLRRGSSLRDAILMRDGEPALTLQETRELAGRILRFTLLVQAAGAAAIAIGRLSLADSLSRGGLVQRRHHVADPGRVARLSGPLGCLG